MGYTGTLGTLGYTPPYLSIEFKKIIEANSHSFLDYVFYAFNFIDIVTYFSFLKLVFKIFSFFD